MISPFCFLCLLLVSFKTNNFSDSPYTHNLRTSPFTIIFIQVPFVKDRIRFPFSSTSSLRVVNLKDIVFLLFPFNIDKKSNKFHKFLKILRFLSESVFLFNCFLKEKNLNISSFQRNEFFCSFSAVFHHS
jgi:hypothetical protein